MITKMCESPSAAFQLPTTTSLLPQKVVTSSNMDNKRETSPKSPTQDSLSLKRARSRYVPYQGYSSPKGSCSSSDNECSENDPNEFIGGVECKSKRLQANSRERKRMHTVNSAFDQLRELVPTYPTNRKLSKIDTLRLACTYIQDLCSVLQQTRLMQGLAPDDMSQFPVYSGDFAAMPGPYSPCFNNGVKSEGEQQYPVAFTSYRPMATTCLTPTCDSDYSTSEPDLSPPSPYLPVVPTSCAIRPPPLARTTSDSAAAATHLNIPLAHATVSVAHPQAQRQLGYPSPLATHAVQHPNGVLMSNDPGLQHSPPIWQRTASYPVFGQ